MAGPECFTQRGNAERQKHECRTTTTAAALTRDRSERLRDARERLPETVVGFGEQRLRAAQLDRVSVHQVAHLVQVTHSNERGKRQSRPRFSGRSRRERTNSSVNRTRLKRSRWRGGGRSTVWASLLLRLPSRLQVYGDDFPRRLEDKGLTDVVSASASPRQNPYVERLIGLDPTRVPRSRHPRCVCARIIASV